MTPDTTEPRWPEGTRLSALLAIGILSAAGALAVSLGHRSARAAIIDLGPTDSHYVHGFRDIERDGPVFFRWSSVPESTVSLPLRFCGPGQVRLRVRRHFLDPASLSVSVSGTVIGQEVIRARDDYPYEVIKFQVPQIVCASDASILLETSVENDRPLGIVVDWLEVRAPDGFRATSATLLRGGLLVGLTSLAFLASGSGIRLAFGLNGALAAAMGLAFASAPVAAERVLRGGLLALVFTLVLGLGIAKLTGVLALPGRYRTAIGGLTLLALLSRSAFLDPQAFYPDYRVHALVQQTLNRGGLSAFLDQLFEIQYARSLGLQQIGGNWYPFPYPPGAYVLTGGIGSFCGLDPLDAAMVTGVTFASLIPLLTLALGISLGLGPLVGLVGALYVSVEPLLVRRMALGYFPGLAGQCFDAVALLLLLAAFRRAGRPLVRVAWLALVLFGAFLVYTQSIANFGLLIAGLLVMETARQSEGGRGGALRIAVAGTLALAASAGAFYWRYLPVIENVQSHTSQPESRVLDRLGQLREKATATEAPEAEDLNDPYAGSTLNPLRGLARLASRLWRFDGPFVLLLAAGSWLLWRESDRSTQNVILALAGVAVWISLLAAGLPSPNGFQHLKDLEFVTPLAALAMGLGTVRLWERHRAAALIVVVAWLVFAGAAFADEWTSRLVQLAGL